MNAAPLPALLSLHDVMPETLERVEDVLAKLDRLGLPKPTLLVVPGRNWQPWHLERLRGWADSGHALAAHGWLHQVNPRRLYHRLHAALLSRDVAEHLDRDAAGILVLIRESAGWFTANHLPPPRLYTPPAWALGRISRNALAGLPVRYVEVLWGIIDTLSGRLHPLPLVGFEADTRWRAGVVRAWNRIQISRARRTGQPLRIGLHPFDFSLRLADDLRHLITDNRWIVPDIESIVS